MNEQNLIPRPFTSGEVAKRMGAKGGMQSTPAKKLAAKLRELKKKGLSDENMKRVFEMMTDKNMSDLDILLLIESMRAKANTVSDKEKVCRMFLEWRKIRYGTKIDITSQSINLDIGMELTPDEISNIIARNKERTERTTGDSVGN